MSDVELAAADVWATGVSPDTYPTQFLRPQLDALGVVPASGLLDVADGDRVLVGGAVTHRQRPATAGVLRSSTSKTKPDGQRGVFGGVVGQVPKAGQYGAGAPHPGRVQNAEGAVTVVADRMQRMDLRVTAKSRDYC